ncbi:hypothetical protein SDC9_207131 [bioreactor metagenome]|uniref:Uncharacterized protein n=1 Tax=bioreactor metagenome TaxID=1076179 RepID=A0A645J8D9_9ZZZZ
MRQKKQIFDQFLHVQPFGAGSRKPGAASLFSFQNVKISKNDRQRCFELMRGIRHKPALLYPGILNRTQRPSGKKYSDYHEHTQRAQVDEAP